MKFLRILTSKSELNHRSQLAILKFRFLGRPVPVGDFVIQPHEEKSNLDDGIDAPLATVRRFVRPVRT